MSKEQKVISFMKHRVLAAVFSLALVLGSIASMFSQGLNLGLDFTGGVAIELGFEQVSNLDQIRSSLKNSENFSKAQVQNYGNQQTVMIKVVGSSGVDTEEFIQELETLLVDVKPFEVKKVDFIGPVVGDELRDQSGMAMLVALFIMLLYVALRFSFKFAVGAVLALFHDVIITFGFFSITQFDFDLTVLAAVLAVIGYSLNDTIVVSDRIRENFKSARMESPEAIIDNSLTQTLGRTIITSATTLFVLFALLAVGGEMIKGFSVALIVGVVIGTYSSIYVASNILMAMKISKQDFIEIQKEAVDDLP